MHNKHGNTHTSNNGNVCTQVYLQDLQKNQDATF